VASSWIVRKGLSDLFPRPASIQAAVMRMISSCSRAALGPREPAQQDHAGLRAGAGHDARP
jgi:hypothetical protein